MIELVTLIKRLRCDGSLLMETRTVQIQKALAAKPDIGIKSVDHKGNGAITNPRFARYLRK